MALIEKITAIANAIREKTGSTGLLTLEEMAEMITYMDVGSGEATTYDNTYILVDENGYEVPAVLTEEEVELTATANDIRLGTTAVTDEGVVTGEKEIPAYYTKEGTTKISAGSAVRIDMYSDRCNYTKLQALLCVYDTSISNSVATEKVSIDGKVYNVGSTDVIAAVTVDTDNQAIDLGITNTSDTPIVIRYFTFTEE